MSALLLSVAIHAQSRDFNIPAGELKSVLEAYMAETKQQIVYNAADLKGRTSKGVQGSMTAEKALELLLEGTNLKLRRDSSGAVVVFFSEGGAPAASDEVNTLERVEVFAQLSHLGDRSRTGTRMDADPMSVPLSVTSIDKDLLAQQQVRNLSDALANVAGVIDVSGNNAFVMRGFAAGTMRNGNLQLVSDGSDVPLISLSKIEVVK
ncbi:secretin and TonB N-terminal domain-containing protein, partial [Roseateles sp. P5_E11]